MKEIQDKITGYCKISKRSILWLQGENTYLKDLELDSTLITGQQEQEFEGEFREKKYIDYVCLNPEVEDMDKTEEVIKIRGFKLATTHEFPGLNICF